MERLYGKRLVALLLEMKNVQELSGQNTLHVTQQVLILIRNNTLVGAVLHLLFAWWPFLRAQSTYFVAASWIQAWTAAVVVTTLLTMRMPMQVLHYAHALHTYCSMLHT